MNVIAKKILAHAIAELVGHTVYLFKYLPADVNNTDLDLEQHDKY